MVLFSYYYCKPILQISQLKGLRDPKYWCTFEPFNFIKAVGDEIRVQAGTVRGNQGAAGLFNNLFSLAA